MNLNQAKNIILPACLALLLLLACSVSGEEVNPPYDKVYRIPLRIHLGNSGRPPEQWLVILEEINHIWLSQAGICFEMQTVDHDDKTTDGFDLWFEKSIPAWNGYYTDRHDMHVRDDPDLGPADNPADSSAARTAAHELGHALNLSHRQDSDDNLMRSKTYGWLLHADEIRTARKNAGKIALPGTDRRSCSINIHNNL